MKILLGGNKKVFSTFKNHLLLLAFNLLRNKKRDITNTAYLHSKCATKQHYQQILAPKEPGVVWKNKKNNNLTECISIATFNKLICDKLNRKVAALQIMPPLYNYNKIVVYDDCVLNSYLAMTRQFKGVPTPTNAALIDYRRFVDRIFRDEVRILINDFQYSFSYYFNHLTRTQQMRLTKVTIENMNRKLWYSIFCKKEKQIREHNAAAKKAEMPKNRCICAPCEEYKFIMAPVVYKLEHIFKRNFSGYRSGLSWESIENITNVAATKYSKLIAFDVSQYDACMRKDVRYAEHKIYDHLYNQGKIWHLPNDKLFLKAHRAETMTLKIRRCDKQTKNYETMITATGPSKRCSGDPQTSFGNTVNMVFVIRYVMEVKLGFKPHEYCLKIAGDDGEILHSSNLHESEFKAAFYEVFTKQKNATQHGLGLTLKYLKFGSLYESDFCSTEAFECLKCGFKMIRQLSRFINLMPYSLKLQKMTLLQQYAYIKALKISNDKWIGDLPIFKQYNDLLYNGIALDITNLVPPKWAITKDEFDVENIADDTPELCILKNLDPDMYWASKTRVSIKCKDCTIGFLKMLNHRYGITEADVSVIISDISKIKDPFNDILHSPTLLQALRFREGFIANY